jgi:hypothetical protein
MRRKIQEQSELNFVSRIIQWPAIGNCPASVGQEGGDEAYYKYVEEADDDADKVSQRPVAHPAGERIVNQILTLPAIPPTNVVITSELVLIKRIPILP